MIADENFVCISQLLHACCMSLMFHSVCIHDYNNILVKCIILNCIVMKFPSSSLTSWLLGSHIVLSRLQSV